MADSYSNFCLNEKLNANFDITWSFQYSVTGSSVSNGGFSTFLFNSNNLEGGGMYNGLGYAPYQEQNGISGFILGVQFDSLNQITVKNTTNFNTLTTIPLFDILSPLIKTNEYYNTIRFNLTNSSQLLNIAVKNKENEYVDLVSIPTEITCKDSDFYRIGFSYASPLKSNNQKINLKIKNIAIQGNKKNPTIFFNNRPPVLTEFDQTFLLQSPSADKIDISYENNSLQGSLLNK